ncbi:MAG: DUF4962 domain-containing protein [Clostridia bacterium]|nr:DUF4962 domain-containing protein [Clostridia bacterium]
MMDMKNIGKQILDDVRARYKKGEHPRLILTAKDFERIKKNRDKGDYKIMVDNVIANADNVLNDPLCEYLIPDGVRLLNMSHRVENRVKHLAMAYRITGEQKYADRAIAEIKAACEFPDFHPRHFLDCAVMCNALAHAYDWLYDVLDEETKALIRKNLIEKGFERIMEEYTNAPEHKKCIEPQRGYRWYQDKPGDNWKFICNGSMALAVLAVFDDEACDMYEPILSHGFEDSYLAVRDFYHPVDGSYSEGLGYWSYGTGYLSQHVGALLSAAGKDYGMTDYIGLKRSPYAALSLSSPDLFAFNFGDAGNGKINAALLPWYQKIFGDKGLAEVRNKQIREGAGGLGDLLWYEERESEPLGEMPLSFGGVGCDNASFRTDVSETAFYAAIHLAKNNAYHGHKDMGTFVMNIGDKRFFVDLGSDNYNLKPYSGSYRYRAEGHNTIIFNPAKENDHEWHAPCTTARFADGEESYAIGDMSAAFPGKRVIRGMKMLRADGSVILQDEIECEAADVIRWSAHTPASIRLFESGKAALLDIDGVKMYVALLADGVFGVRAAAPDENSPEVLPAPSASNTTPQPQAVNNGISKLEVHLSGASAHRIAVWFYPLTDGREIPKERPSVKPLSIW